MSWYAGQPAAASVALTDRIKILDVSDESEAPRGSEKYATIEQVRGVALGGSGDTAITGADPTGVTDSLAAIQAYIDDSGANSEVIIPNGTYLLTGPLVVIQDNLHIVLRPGATLTATDVGASAFTTVEIDDTKVGMPQMKALVAFLGCTGSSISGGGTVNAAGLEWLTGTGGQSGVFVRGCSNVIVEDIKVLNVWPATLLLPGRDVTVVGDGGIGDDRFSGICLLQCADCIVRHCYVEHCKYDGICARDANTDIEISNNWLTDQHEAIQTSPWYGTVNPREDNLRTVIKDNIISNFETSAITIHSDYSFVDGNYCHTPLGHSVNATAGIAAVGSTQCDITNNLIEGIEEADPDDMVTFNFRGIRNGVLSSSKTSGNVIRWCNEGIVFPDSVTTNPHIVDNFIQQCNTGIDVRVDGDTSTRNRTAIIADNFVGAYRYGIRAQDTNTRIVNNRVAGFSGWSGTSIGLDLDNEANGDTNYLISASLPVGFDTAISLPAPTNPVTASYQTFIEANNVAGGDRYFNRGLLEIASGNLSGTDLLSTNLSPAITPGPGEVHVTQMSGTPVPFKWSASATTLTITLAANAPDDLTFGWTVHLMGYVV